MDTLIFATNNQDKADEVRQVLGNLFAIITLKEAGITIDIPEPYDTLEANASLKSATIYNLTGKNCFSEDTGLQVFVLNGDPGVKSARYAGENASSKANIEKLLHNMGTTKNRGARFRTIISLILNKKEFQFEGICEGEIIPGERGQHGFGYDPVFVPTGSKLTFGEMTTKEKSAFSHRKKAMDKLILFLQSLR
ncbi:MAG: RdgB/HAM1 family non-canonical purine NTP pyrophosphatase [Ferruginibacter sp.]|nr:RdgB/HAM1 family non-canonical purine NTP pyrophosphatase [Ferruginibacter sp.]